MLDEFYRIAFRKKLYETTEDLQADLDLWMREFNEARPHQGKWCFGKTPMQTFLDALSLARKIPPGRRGKPTNRRVTINGQPSPSVRSNRNFYTSLFTGGGPGAMLAFSAATPPAAKLLRHSRTVSSRTPNASAIRGLLQPVNVSNTARARSASPRSREPARAARAARCSLLATTGDFPAMPHTSQIDGGSKSQKTYSLVNQAESA